MFDEESVDVCRAFTKLKARLMPYIYRIAVNSHETGVPSMRPMVLEFDNDPAVRYLDMQYMLGDSVLVAPIFREDGNVDYYLPKGTWTHLLSGETREGGTWQNDTYDYFSLPVYVRENTLLAMGAEEDRPDYDYTKDVQLQLYALKDGCEADCEITDLKGNIVLTAKASRTGNKITVTVSEITEGMTYLLVNVKEAKNISGAKAETTEKGIVLTPESKEVVIEL